MSERNVLITGSAIRVGRTLALRLAREGWNVAIHCNTSKKEANTLAKEINKLGRKAVVVTGDLEDAKTPARIIKEATKKLGALSCLINNASIFKKDSLANFSEENLVSQFQVNAFAPLRLIKDFAAQCPKGGNIINITDGMKGWSMSPNFLTYTLSKMMLANITELLARELAPHIRINMIAPGPSIPGHMDKPDTFKKLAGIIPLKRISSADEIADAVLFLLQSRSITGQCIDLSGGMNLSPKGCNP